MSPQVGQRSSKKILHFPSPDSEEGKSIQNVLQRFKIADELYRYKPSDGAKIVRRASGKAFSVHDHAMAWQKYAGAGLT